MNGMFSSEAELKAVSKLGLRPQMLSDAHGRKRRARRKCRADDDGPRCCERMTRLADAAARKGLKP